MRITSSALQLAQQHSASSSTKVQERLSVWQDRDAARPATARIGAGAGTSAGATVQVRAELSQTTARSGVLLQLSDAARQARAQDVPGLALGRPAVLAGQVPAAHGANADTVDRTSATAATTDEEDAVEPRLLMLARMVEAMTGFKVRVTVADTGRGSGASAHGEVPPQAAGGAAAQGQSEAPQRVGWGLEYDRVVVRHESERSTFVARGRVQTADGRTLDLAVGLQMERSHSERESVSVRAGDAVMKDPLVLHFDGALPALTDTRFAFDIDADGQTENIPFVGQGSGFLVLDRNRNGRADDGSELFGAVSGNGFAELAAWDDDGNGWIDEADSVFAELRLWQKDASGQDQWRTLAQADVGAVSVQAAATPFSLRNDQNATLGQVRASSVYLRESTGQAGVVQQIDVAV